MADDPLPKLAERVHLSVSGSVGGTTLCLQYARGEIISGGRVLWGSDSMPDPARFGQLFDSVDIVSSSRFHALQLGSNLEGGIQQLIDAHSILPRVGLIVVDDWAPRSGQTPISSIELAKKLLSVASPSCTVLLTSKSYADPSSTEADYRARGGSELESVGCETWWLSRPEEGGVRILSTEGGALKLQLVDAGFKMS